MNRLALVCGAALMLGPFLPTAEAAPGAGRKAPSSRTKRRRAPKREFRRGLPVLRSKAAPQHRRKVKNPERAAAASEPDAQNDIPIAPIDPTVTAALISGMPDSHIELSAQDGLVAGNAAMSFKGRVSKKGYIQTDWLNIAYPMPGAMGRELTLECSGYFKGDTVVSTATAWGIFDTVYDQVVFKAPSGKTYRETIKLLIDTEAMAQPSGIGYRIVLTGDLAISQCTLDLAED